MRMPEKKVTRNESLLKVSRVVIPFRLLLLYFFSYLCFLFVFKGATVR